MHVEITRILTRWLSHPQYGVNKLAPLVPRENMDGKKDPAPVKVDIYNDVDFDLTSIAGITPPSVPSLVIVADLDLRSSDIAQATRQAHLIPAIAGIGYYAEPEYKSDAIKAGNYVLRAVGRSLKLLNEPNKYQPVRELNNIMVARVVGVVTQRVAGAVPPSGLLGIMFADLQVMNKAP